MKKTDIYRVNEIFQSLQGEGYHTGTPAVFLRFSGCNRRCHFCDTDFSAFTEMTAEEIADACAAFRARHLVVTGGEPLLQLDEPLIKVLKERGFYIQTETNGSLPVPAGVDWVTCSPKAEPWGVDRVDELKLVFENRDVESFIGRFGEKVRFLQPCSGENIPETIAYILEHPHWRLSLQTHKLLDIR